MKAVWLIQLLLFSGFLMAQSGPYDRFIPPGYAIMESGIALGDLNKDGLKDVALALYHVSGEQNREADSVPPRIMMILVATPQGFIQALQSRTALLCGDCGGAFGDPFTGIEILKGVLLLYHYGGSNWRWSYTHRFRFQQGDWYLIGATRQVQWIAKECEKLGGFAGTDMKDENFLTGGYRVLRISETCELLEKKKGRAERRPLIKLTEFNIDN